jgi:hypothetical protein
MSNRIGCVINTLAPVMAIGTTSTLGALLLKRREEILAIAARHHGRRVRIFGSVARGHANAGSDIDFLVDFDLPRYVLFRGASAHSADNWPCS